MLALAGAFTPVASHAADGTWTFQSATPATAWAGSWALGANWATTTIADGVDAIANFNAIDLQAAVTINLDGMRTIGTLNLGDTATGTVFGYSFNSYGNSGRLIFDVSSGSAAINLQAGGQSASAIPTINVPILLNDNLNVNLNSAVATANGITINGNISGSGTLNIIGAGSPTTPSAAVNTSLTGVNTNAGFTVSGTRVSANAYSLGVDSSTTVAVQNGGQLFLNAGGAYRGNITISGYGFNEAGHGGLGAMRLESGSNAFFGTLNVDASSIPTARIASNLTAGTNSATFYGGIGETGGVANVDFGRWANGGAAMAGLFTLASSTGYTGKTYISSGTLAVGQGGTVGDINSSSDVAFGFDNSVNNPTFTQVNGTATLQFNRADNVTFTKAISQTTAGAVSITGSLIHAGLGNVTVDNGNAGYTGTTTVSSTGGKLVFGTGGAYTWAAAGAVTLSNGGDLEFNTSSNVALNQALTGVNNAGSFVIQSGTGTLSFGGATANSGSHVMVNSGTLSLEKTATATVRSTNDLALIVNGGTAILGAAGTGDDQILNTSDVQINGGTFDLNGKNETFDVLTGSGGTVTNTGNANSVLTLGSDNSNINTGYMAIQNNALWNGAGSYLSNYGGVITNGTNTLGVTKSGTGLQTLSGSNTYTGATTVSAGTLSITGSTVSTGAVSADGGTLAGTGSVGNVTLTTTAGSTINPGATSLDNATGTLTANSLTVNGGTLRLNLGATGVTSDKIAVTTTANFAAASTLQTAFTAPPTAGTYTLLTTASAGLTGTLPTYTAPANTRYTYTLDPLNTTPDALTLTVGGSNATSNWSGGASNVWDFATSGNFSGGATDFKNFDVITFADGPTNRAPNIATGVSVEAPLTFINSVGNDYSVNVTGTGKLTGLTSISKTGNGVLTINGAHDYFGDVNVTGGTLIAGSATAFGSAIGQTYVSNGGTININGQTLGNEVFNIAGAGVGGNGALINNGAGNNNALRYVKLTDDATVGSTLLDGGGRFDVRDQTAGAYTGFLDAVGERLDLNGKTLTKEGMNQFSVVNADMTVGTVNINRGTFAVEVTTPIRPGTVINTNPFGSLSIFATGQNLNPGQTGFHQGTVNLNGGTVNQTNNTNNVTSSAYVVPSLGFLNFTTGNTVLNGGISGAGVLVKQGGGALTLNTANSGFTGHLVETNGTIDIGDAQLTGIANGLSGNAGGWGSGNVSVINGTTFRNSRGTNWTLPAGVNVLNANFRNSPPLQTNTLTINTPLGTDYMSSNFIVDRGTVALGSGADLRFNNIQIGTTAIGSGNVATLNIGSGTNISATFFEIGTSAAGNTGVVNQTGGSIKVMGNGDTNNDGGFRVGHWSGSVPQYHISGGSLNVPYGSVAVGVDGLQPLVNLSGTGLIFARQVNVDTRNGANAPFSATFNISGGELMVGVGGLVRGGNGNTAAQQDINWTGGKISAWGNWGTGIVGTTALNPINVEGSREFEPNGYLINVGGLQGPGSITLNENGVLALGGAGTIRGPIDVNTGVLRAGNPSAFGLTSGVTVANGATFDTGGQSSAVVAPALRPTINVQGTGIAGQAAVWSSAGGTGNQAVFGQLNLTGDATIGGNTRGTDLANNGINMNGFTLTKVGVSELAYSPTSTANMGNFVVESGFLTVQSNNALGGAGTGTISANPGGEIRSWFGAAATGTNSKPVVLNGGVLATGGGGANVAEWTGGTSLTANSSIGRIAQGGYNSETDRVLRLAGDLTLNDFTLTKLNRTPLQISSLSNASNGNITAYGGSVTLMTNSNMTGTGVVKIGGDASIVLDDGTGVSNLSKSLILAGGLLQNANGNHTFSNSLDVIGHARLGAAAATALTVSDINVPARSGVTFDTTGTITPTLINGATPTGRLSAAYTAGAGATNTTFAEIVAGNVAAISPTLNTTGVALSTALATDDVLNTTAANAVITSDLTIRSLTTQVDAFVNNGALLTIADGGVVNRAANHWLQTNAGAQGRITTGLPTGELYFTAPTHFETITDIGMRLQVVDAPLAAGGFNPVTIVKTGPGALTKLGSANFPAANTAINNLNSGGFVINSGRVTLEGGTGLGLGNVSVRDGGSLLFLRPAATLNLGVANNINLSGIGMGEAAGILGAMRLINGETIDGTVRFLGRSRIHADTLGVLSGLVAGTSASPFEKTGGGLLFLANPANTYAGVTEIGTRDLAGGVLGVSKLSNGGSASSIGQTTAAANRLILDGGTLRYMGKGDSTNKLFTVGINGATIDARGFGSLNLTSTGSLAVAPGTSRNLTLGGDYDTTLLNAVNGSLPNNTFAPSFGDPTHGFVNLFKGGSSIWTITSNLPGLGTTTVQNGQLRVGDGGTSGTLPGGATPIAVYGHGVVTLQNQGDLVFNRSDAITVKNQIIGADVRTEIVQVGSGTLTLGGLYDNTNAAIRVENGVVELAKETVAGALLNSGRAAGATGAQTAGSNAGVTINAGTLRLAGINNADDQIANNVEVFMRGGTFDMNGRYEMIGRLEGTSGVVNGGGILEVGGFIISNNTSFRGFAGTIAGNTNLIKAGTGSAVLTGDSTANGSVTVNQGRLVLGYSGTSGSLAGGASVTAGGTLTYNRADNITIANAVTGAGVIEQAGSGTATLSAQPAVVLNQLAVRRGGLNIALSGANTSTQILGNVTLDGGRLSVIGNPVGTSTFRMDGNSIAMNGGNLRVDGGTGSGTELIILNTNGSLARGTGSITGTINFEAVNGGVIRTNAVNSANGYINTANHAYATYNGNDWAAQVGNSTLGAFTGYVNNAYAANNNTNVTADFTFTGATTTDTIRFATAAATNLGLDAQTLSLGRGGILNGPAVGANITTVSGGSIIPVTVTPVDARGADIIVHQNNTAAEMVISATLANPAGNPATQNGTNAANAAALTGLASTAGLYVGMPVTGTNIPANSYIAAVNSGTQITLNQNITVANTANPLTFGGYYTGFVKAGDGVLRLTGANTFGGAVTVNAGKLIIGDGATSGSIADAVNAGIANPFVNDGIVAWSRSDTATTTRAISGFGEVRQEGTGTLNLNAANSFAGGLTVSKGTVQTNNNSGFGAGVGGIPGLVTLGDADTGANNVALLATSTGVLTIPNHITVSALGSGTATIGSASNTAAIASVFTGAINLNRATIFGGNLDRTTFTGPISGNVGTLTIAKTTPGATGRVDLQAENTFTGNVVIQENAILQVGSGVFSDPRNQLPDSADISLTGTAAAILQLNGDNETIGTLNSANVNAELRTIAAGPSILTVTNGGTYNGKVTGGTGATHFTLETTGGTLTLGGTTDNVAGNLLVNGGTVILNKTAATMRAVGAVATVNTGTLQLSGTNGDQIADAAVVNLNGGTVDLNGLSETIGALNGLGGTIKNTGVAASTLTLGGTNGNSTGFFGTISDDVGTIALVKTGTGSMLLGSDNNYSGGTTISGGNLQVGAGGAAGSLGSGPLVNNSLLSINRTGSLTIAGAISGSGPILHNGGGTTTLTANSSTFTGPIVVNAGTLVVNNNVGTGNVTIALGATLTGSNGTMGDVAVAGGTLSPGTGTGTLTMGDLNVMTGSTVNFDLTTVSSYDQINVSGGLTIGTGVTANFTSTISTGLPTDYLFLMINDGADPIIGTFGGVAEGAIVSINGVDFTATYLADSATNSPTGGNDFALIVPEPGSAALLLGGLAMLAGRRRRK